MGCGCGGRKTLSSVNNAKSTVSRSTSTPKVRKNVVCIEKYDELSLLDRKVIALHNKFRFSQVGYRYSEIQKTIRGWIIDLKTKCPDEDELKEYAEYINSEYVKYFKG